MNNNPQGNQSTKLSKQPWQRKDKQRIVDASSLVYGKVPPQAKDLEEAILGAIMLEKGAFDIVAEIIQDQAFYVEAHQIIFRACSVLSQKGQPMDILTVVQELRSLGELDAVGGPYYVTKLTNNVVSSANIEFHSRIVLQKFIARELIRNSMETIAGAYDDSSDVLDLFDKAESGLFEISSNHFKSDYTRLGDGLPEFINRIEFLATQESSITGVPSGFHELDRITHGWQKTDLIILAARPSVGKTAFALNLAKGAATHPYKKTPVGLFSLEMGSQQLLKRVMSMESGIWMERLSSGKVNDMTHLLSTGNNVDQMPIYIDDTAELSIMELRAKARRMVQKHKVGLIIIDYLQLMNGGSYKGNREQEISSISRGLKKLAKDLDIPVIALSQLSRGVEARGKGQKIPMLSDLRESGAIEQDADMVMFLYRPPEDEVEEDAALENTGSLKIAKHRNGALEDFVFQIDNKVQRWEEVGLLERKKFRRLASSERLESTYTNQNKTETAKPEDPEELPF